MNVLIPAPPAHKAPPVGGCEGCAYLNAENERLAWLSSMQSAAAKGVLQPDTRYEGKPIEPIEEVLRLRRVALILAEAAAEAVTGEPVGSDTILRTLTAAEKQAKAEIPEPR